MTDAADPLPSLGRDKTAGDFVPRRDSGSLSHAVTGADLRDSATTTAGDDATDSLDHRYEITAPLGRGGMGDVFRGKDRKLGREVAIKRIREEFAGSRVAFDRFRREAHAIAALNHPHIVRVFDFGRDEHGPFLVMELVEGESLAELLARVGTLGEEAVRQLGEQLCDALGAAHRRGIIHRDVKPANILLRVESGELRVESEEQTTRAATKTLNSQPATLNSLLSDFGLARDHTDGGGMTQSGAVLGTLDYMPPEQRRDVQAVDARSDLWSLGATLYETLTGEPPRILSSDRLPAALREAIVKSLEPNPDERFQTAEAFRAALFGVAGAGPQGSPGTGTNPTRKRGRREPLADASGYHALQPRPPGSPPTCRKCGRQNSAESEFCAGCGAVLADDPCLRCGRLLPAGVTFCGDCGGNVAEEIARKQRELQAERAAVETLVRRGLVRDAASRLAGMAAVKHSALDDVVGWAARNLDKARERWARLERDPGELLDLARERFDDGDYSGAAAILQQADPPRRTPAIRRMLDECEGREKRIAWLSRKIRTSVTAKEFHGLLPAVEEFLKLKPDDDGVRRLRSKLVERERAVRSRRLQPASRRRRPAEDGHYEPKRGLPPVAWGGIAAGVLVIVIGVAWLVRFAFFSGPAEDDTADADQKAPPASVAESKSPATQRQEPPQRSAQLPPPSNLPPAGAAASNPPQNGLGGSGPPGLGPAVTRRRQMVVEYEVLSAPGKVPPVATLRSVFARVPWAQASGVRYDAARNRIVVPAVGGNVNTGIGAAALKGVGVDVGRQSISSR